MTAQQRDMIDQILRSNPFDLGGDVTVQRRLLEQMLTAQPLPADVRVTPGELGGKRTPTRPSALGPSAPGPRTTWPA